jgi:hypothetical protein
MIAVLTIVVTLGNSSAINSFEVYPLADQSAYDHCMDIAKHTKESLAKDLQYATYIATSCIDKGEPTE